MHDTHAAAAGPIILASSRPTMINLDMDDCDWMLLRRYGYERSNANGQAHYGFFPPFGVMPGNSGVSSVRIFHDAPVSRIARKSTGL